MIVDHHNEKWGQKWDDWEVTKYQTQSPTISKEEIEEFLALVKKARKYDREHHEHDCESKSKKEVLESLMRKMGVNLTDVMEVFEDG